MKRILSGLLAVSLIAGLLTGCGGDGGTDGTKVKKKDITLSYANWNLGTVEENNIERQMIKAFEDKTGITVKIEESVQGEDYSQSLATLAGGSKMPDVFMLENLPLGIENDWMLDVSAYTNKDADWKTIPSALEEVTHFGDKVLAIPAGFFMAGYYVNDKLFDANNLDKLDIGFTYDQFENAVKKLTNLSKQTVGIMNETNLIEWYAAAKNDSYGWFTWDGTEYHLNSAEFKEGMDKVAALRTAKYSYDSLSESERAAFGTVTKLIEVWNAGKVGLYYESTAQVNAIATQSDFDKRFIGLPGGRTALIADFLSISPSTKYPEEAYEFAKWMSFDPDGIKKRLELDTDGTMFNSLPLSTDQSVLDAYFARDNIFPGVKDAYNKLDKAIVESVKIVPGYGDSRWSAQTGIKIADANNANIGQLIDAAWFGSIKYGDYADQVNKMANESHATAVEKINQKF